MLCCFNQESFNKGLFFEKIFQSVDYSKDDLILFVGEEDPWTVSDELGIFGYGGWWDPQYDEKFKAYSVLNDDKLSGESVNVGILNKDGLSTILWGDKWCGDIGDDETLNFYYNCTCDMLRDCYSIVYFSQYPYYNDYSLAATIDEDSYEHFRNVYWRFWSTEVFVVK